MEFTITCPIDGPVTVSLEDIDTVVLRETQSAEITFECPLCGESITVQAQIPHFLMAAIEAMAEESDDDAIPFASIVALVSSAEASQNGPESIESTPAETRPAALDPVADAYCEYFRRQLEGVECVEDFLAEVDVG